VHLFEAQHGILPNEDPDAAAIVRQSLERDGVQVVCCGTDLRIDRSDAGARIVVDSHGQHIELTFDEILVSTGRAPNVGGLGLEQAGVAFDRSGVRVNDFLQTTNRSVYAAGDICSRHKFTHVAEAMARIVIQNALFWGRKRTSALTIPWCTYTDPEVAHVGYFPREAEEQGIPVVTHTIELSHVDRAILDGDQEGFLKVHTRRGKDRILGATLVAPHAGEMISEITLAMVAGAGLRVIANTIHPYPTQAEAMRKAGDAFNRMRLTPGIQRLFSTLLSWRR
jgi:pyruvate/2-oxoglutarate dehydrogenase complex dihydrolipoamide dehydrogenase (E3) component